MLSCLRAFVPSCYRAIVLFGVDSNLECLVFLLKLSAFKFLPSAFYLLISFCVEQPLCLVLFWLKATPVHRKSLVFTLQSAVKKGNFF